MGTERDAGIKAPDSSKPALMQRIIRAAVILTCSLIWLAAFVWSLQPAVLALAASLTAPVPTLNQLEGLDSRGAQEIKREIQKHYRNYDTYIPLEDMYLVGEPNDTKVDMSFLMQKACGRATLYLWLPLRVRLPLEGEKVFDWCWTFNPSRA